MSLDPYPFTTAEGETATEILTDEGALFTPVYDSATGAIGYRVDHPDRPSRYILLNPSGGNDTGDVDDTNVFVYVEPARKDMELCEAQCYINIWDKAQ